MRVYIEKRAQRIKDPARFVCWRRTVSRGTVCVHSMGMEENAADMAEHDPELFRECYGEDPTQFLEKHRKDKQEAAELRAKYKDCKFSARIVE